MVTVRISFVGGESEQRKYVKSSVTRLTGSVLIFEIYSNIKKILYDLYVGAAFK